ncbi:hypothetical protein C1949_17405 [Halopseudomonas oceani]|uniref:Uncharacterized protein n=2 Tax=Halopseudomonas oceani TaxID=1708783 RepID=A0A2P4EQX9_9GAMM|nr:hypothetical protein C1949_17405 [Halopseudomonas oceani]
MGCGRLLDEILEWGKASDSRQCEIIDAARQRRIERNIAYTAR